MKSSDVKIGQRVWDKKGGYTGVIEEWRGQKVLIRWPSGFRTTQAPRTLNADPPAPDPTD